MGQLNKYGALLARILLAAIFIMAGFSKIGGFAGTQAYMASRGMPATAFLAVGALLIEIAGGLSIIVGYKARLGAFILFLFLIPTTLIFHTPLGGAFPAEQVQLQQVMVMKNMAIMGGLLAIAVHGAGGLSFDSRQG